jgi:HSP20 family protein
MAELTRWSPRELLSPFEDIREEMDRMFRGFFAPRRLEAEEGRLWYPAVDLEEETDHYALIAELPGIKKDDIKVSLSDGILTLSGERKSPHEEERTGFHRHERCYGKFQRAFNLPSQVDANKIKAMYRDGVLEVDIPKSEEAKLKAVEVKIG